MLSEYEKIYHQVEENHWWNCSRRDLIYKLIHTWKMEKGTKILDVGCSTGVLLDGLSKIKNIEVSGVDVSGKAINACHDKGLINTWVMEGEKLNFENSVFDIVIASDCLEHIKQDQKALKEWYRVLKNQGKLIILGPAFMALWSEQDNLSNHFRRYHRNELRLILKKTEFKIHRLSFWNTILFIPILTIRFLFKLIKTETNMTYNQLQVPNPLINRVLKKLLIIENMILMKTNLPIGVSLFAICQKK
jgi:SAM-dependent methyltransferase